MFNPNEQTHIHYWDSKFVDLNICGKGDPRKCPTDVFNSCTYTYKSNITNCISLNHHCASMTVLQI